MVRIGQVQKPHKGCPSRLALRCRSGEGVVKVDRYSEVRAYSSSDRQGEPSTWEESWGSPGQGLRNQTLEGQKPKGGAGGRRPKTPCGDKAIPAGSNLETEARRAGLTRKRRRYR